MRHPKTVLLSVAVTLGLSAAAHAEISLSGDARMGIMREFDYFPSIFSDSPSVQFTSRARVRVDMSGQTDGGLSFGASVLMNEASLAQPDPDNGRNWVAGQVYIAGPFGKLSMGDTDSAVEAAVGHVSAVSLTGLDDNHETTLFQKAAGARLGPSVLYEYYGTGWAGFASVTNRNGNPWYEGDRVTAIGGRYVIGDLTLSAGIEQLEQPDLETVRNTVVGIDYQFGDFGAKAVYGTYESPYFSSDTFTYETYTAKQFYMSLDWEQGPWVVAAFYARPPDSGDGENNRYYGIGAAYDLGGGAALTGGVVVMDRPEAQWIFGDDSNQTAFDFGLTMSF